MSKYANTRTNLVSAEGGSVRVTITSSVGRGNGGASLPCRAVLITQASGNTGQVKVNIGTPAESGLGIDIPKAVGASPVPIAIDDVNKLYFYSASDNDTVDILWRT